MTTDKRHGKTALVLAGGGLTGAVYHIGALRAIDDLLLDRTVNDFDIYVGTSAGALISSFLANGFSPEEMLKTLDGSNDEIDPIRRRDIFSINGWDLLRWSLKFPKKLVDTGLHLLQDMGSATLLDTLWDMSEVIPAGIYDGMSLERYVRNLLINHQRHNDFRKLERELYIIATDLDSGERAVFGEGFLSDVPISLAVAASSALPLVYKPVRIGEQDYVDGGLRGTASLDLAIERGATLVVCINPLVPLDNTRPDLTLPAGSPKSHLSEQGISCVADQVLRIFSHAGLQYHIKQISRHHPEVDIVLIEPSRDDYRMNYSNIMHYATRLRVARHGFESVTLDLAQEYPRIKRLLARHGILMSRRLVIEELAQIQASGNDPRVIRQVLEARSSICGRPSRDTPACNLARNLADLENVLENFSP